MIGPVVALVWTTDQTQKYSEVGATLQAPSALATAANASLNTPAPMLLWAAYIDMIPVLASPAVRLG